MLCGNLNGKEIQTRGDICVHVADSLCHTADLTQLGSVTNYNPIKKVKKNNETVTILFEGIRMSTAQLDIHESSKAL